MSALTQQFLKALQAGDPNGAITVARQMLATNAMLGDQWGSIARFAAMQGEWSVARDAMRRFVNVDPRDIGRHLAEAEILSRCGHLATAVERIAGLAQRYPREPNLRHFLGVAYGQMGDFERSRGELLATINLMPQAGPSWLALAQGHRFKRDDPDFARIVAARDRVAGAAPELLAPYFYALGKAFDDVGDVDRAFAAFADGAAIAKRLRPYDLASDRRGAELAMSLDASDVRSLADRWHGVGAIFVTGIPRSGTTLVEQILASHSRVAGGDEINVMPLALGEAGVTGIGAADLRGAIARRGGTANWAQVREAYDHLLAERFGPTGIAIDKTLSNTRLAGIIAVMMAGTPIVWLRRDPLDTAWSCFRTYFEEGVEWSFAQADLAQHMALEDRVFAHFAPMLPDQVLPVPYDALVQAPDQWIPRIAEHCGLAVEPAMFAFDKTERAVMTSSAAQVRQPITTRAIGSAEPYRDHLALFIDAYRALGGDV